MFKSINSTMVFGEPSAKITPFTPIDKRQMRLADQIAEIERHDPDPLFLSCMPRSKPPGRRAISCGVTTTSDRYIAALYFSSLRTDEPSTTVEQPVLSPNGRRCQCWYGCGQ